jgi:cobalt-zinc-cadmium efflux system membrane fusion protein
MIRFFVALLLSAAIVGAAIAHEKTPAGNAAPAAKHPDAPNQSHGDQGHGDKGHGHAQPGIVQISDAKLAAAGIEVLTATAGTLRNAIILNGILQPNQEALVQVTPRFPGVVREIKKSIGDSVEKGELLAKVESNQSLTVYEMRAPISGTVIDRQISLGEYASEQKPAFVVADMSTVWVDLSVYRRDLPRVRIGDTVLIDVGDGGAPIEARLSYVSPVGNTDTQSALVRAVVDNKAMRLRTGLFVSARLLLSARQVPVVVKTSALQTVDNKNVVFVRHGDTFAARAIEIGARDAEHVEIVSGLRDGDRYAATNSFVVKAELGKGEASHDH